MPYIKYAVFVYDFMIIGITVVELRFFNVKEKKSKK